MAGERASSAHQLLEIRLIQTANLIPIAVRVDLAGMSNSSMLLTRVARASSRNKVLQTVKKASRRIFALISDCILLESVLAEERLNLAG